MTAFFTITLVYPPFFNAAAIAAADDADCTALLTDAFTSKYFTVNVTVTVLALVSTVSTSTSSASTPASNPPNVLATAFRKTSLKSDVCASMAVTPVKLCVYVSVV